MFISLNELLNYAVAALNTKESLEAIVLVVVRDDSIGRVIDEIGPGKACFTQNNLNDLKSELLKNGYPAAEGKAAQMIGTDGQVELLRALTIMQKHNLSPEAAADVLDNLAQIKAGHY